MKVVQGRIDPDTQRMASPGEARSIAALFLAAGARPDEIDGSVEVLIEQSQGRMSPRSYRQVAEGPIDAIAEYRRRQQFSIVEADQEAPAHAE